MTTIEDVREALEVRLEAAHLAFQQVEQEVLTVRQALQKLEEGITNPPLNTGQLIMLIKKLTGDSTFTGAHRPEEI